MQKIQPDGRGAKAIQSKHMRTGSLQKNDEEHAVAKIVGGDLEARMPQS
jgi:hypothetical protein